MRKVMRYVRRNGGLEKWAVETWYLLGFIPIYRKEVLVSQ